jgi:hypothetical protein
MKPAPLYTTNKDLQRSILALLKMRPYSQQELFGELGYAPNSSCLVRTVLFLENKGNIISARVKGSRRKILSIYIPPNPEAIKQEVAQKVKYKSFWSIFFR